MLYENIATFFVVNILGEFKKNLKRIIYYKI